MGSEGNADGAQIQEVLHGVISSGSIASYVTSPQGFQFRRLGTGEPILEPGATPPGSQTHVRPLPPFSVPTMVRVDLPAGARCVVGTRLSSVKHWAGTSMFGSSALVA